MHTPIPPCRRTATRKVAFALSVFALALCSGPTAQANHASKPAAAPASKSARPKIAIGMTAAEIRALIGAPTKIKKVPRKEGVEAEVWYYDFTVPGEMRDVALTTRDVPYINPKTGVETIIKEPVYSQVQDYVTETTALVMVDGVLTGSKRYRSVSRDFD